MNDEKKSMYTGRLQLIRAELMGVMGKTINTSKEAESAQNIPEAADSATLSYDRQLVLTLGEQGWEKLKLVDEALDKLRSQEFGICGQCEKPVPEARLDLVPFAQYCVLCLDQIEEKNKLQKNGDGN